MQDGFNEVRIQLSLGLTDKAGIRLESKRKIDVYTVKDRSLPLAKVSCSETKVEAFPASSQKKPRAVQYPEAGLPRAG